MPQTPLVVIIVELTPGMLYTAWEFTLGGQAIGALDGEQRGQTSEMHKLKKRLCWCHDPSPISWNTQILDLRYRQQGGQMYQTVVVYK